MPELFEFLDSKFILSLRGAHINYSPLADSSLAQTYSRLFPKIHAFHAVSKAIMDLNVRYNIPFIFGVLTCDTMEQAQDRAGGKHGNKGVEAAMTALGLRRASFSPSYHSETNV